MNKPLKPRSAIREFLSPGPAAFDQQRPYRVFLISLLVGIVVAVAFGFALYYLNKSHRF